MKEPILEGKKKQAGIQGAGSDQQSGRYTAKNQLQSSLHAVITELNV